MFGPFGFRVEDEHLGFLHDQNCELCHLPFAVGQDVDMGFHLGTDNLLPAHSLCLFNIVEGINPQAVMN